MSGCVSSVQITAKKVKAGKKPAQFIFNDEYVYRIGVQMLEQVFGIGDDSRRMVVEFEKSRHILGAPVIGQKNHHTFGRSRGEGPGGIGSAGYDAPVLSILVRPLHPYPAEAYRSGIRSMVVRTRKVPCICLDPTIKCGNYLPNILARRELEAQGMIEGVQLTVEGQVTSGTVSNVFLVKDARLCTPDVASGILSGITRAALIEVAAQVGLEVVEQRIEVADLYQTDELFFANTLMECLPVAEIDGRKLAPAPGVSTQALHAAFRELVDREVSPC